MEGHGSSAFGLGVRAWKLGLRPRILGRPFIAPAAVALAFRVRGCFVILCFRLALGVGRAARAVVSFGRIIGRRMALVVIQKKNGIDPTRKRQLPDRITPNAKRKSIAPGVFGPK